MLAFFVRRIARATLLDDWNKLCVPLDACFSTLERSRDPIPSIAAQRLLVSGEDHRHRYHAGYDVHAICRALWRGIRCGFREGASTIDQQLVRVVSQRFEKTIPRKVREVLLASLVAHRYPKSAVPAMFLRVVYYGWRMNGYEEACARMGFRPCRLSLTEGAELVARIKYPEPQLTPAARRDDIDRRVRHLLALYNRHVTDGTYGHLSAVAFPDRSAATGFLRSAPGSRATP